MPRIKINIASQELGLLEDDGSLIKRYLVIHGSPDSAQMGVPGSIGCVRMYNRDIIELFDLVPVYTPVEIHE